MATRTNDPMFQRGSLLGNRYRLDDPLATGGMAEVWRGHDTVLQRPVAIKILHPHLANEPAVVERFRREAIAAARLAHPHIVPTYDTGTDGKSAFIVMSLVSGATLREAIAQSPLPVREAVTIGRQVADALEHAHRNGLVHRDVKPSNVLIVEDSRRAMVVDFGIAKAVAEASDSSLTLPGLVVGTPAYSSPEQLAGQTVDARTDIYATGVLLHEMVCGHTGAEHPTQLGAAAGAEAASHSCPNLDSELAPIIERATAVDPMLRYQRARDLRDALADLERRLVLQAATSAAAPSAPPADTSAHESVFSEPATQATETVQRATAQGALAEPGPATTVFQAASADARKREARADRRKSLAFATAAVLVVGAVVLGRLVASIGESPDDGPISTPPAGNAAAPVAGALTASAFDPFGDGNERTETARNAVDGNPSTRWTTEGYNQPTFGTKPGVGLVVKVPSQSNLARMTVQSPSQNWSADVYVASGSPTSLPGWGERVDSQSGLGSEASFDLHNRPGDSVLLWITNVGNARNFSVSELSIASAPS